MKRTLSFIIATAVVVAFSAPSFAYPRPVEKLKGGVVTMVKSPLEIREHTMAEAKPGSFMLFSVPGGMLKGTFYMARNMVRGAWDVATFPISK